MNRHTPLLVLVGLLFLGASVALAVVRGSHAVARADESLGWEAAALPRSAALECPSAARDFSTVTSPVRKGRAAAHFHLDPASTPWSNGMPRCLETLYGSGERAGQEHYYGFSLYFPEQFNALIWELHQPSSIYSLPSCGLAPFALHTERFGGLNGVYFRIATGDCTPGKRDGWTHQELNIPLRNLRSMPTGTWVDFVIRIKFSEQRTGVVQVWDRYGGRPYQLDLSRGGIPTTQYCSSCGIRNVKLYQELGLYAPAGTTADLFVDAFRRGPSFASVAP